MRRQVQARRGVRWALCLLTAALWVLSATACSKSEPVVSLESTSGQRVPVTVELALTRETQARGLMFRQDMPKNYGMLFVFDDEQKRNFWMRNTPLPLDIIYINAERRIVSIAKHTTPYSEKRIPSGKPAKYVLEVNAGFCDKHDVAVGSTVELPAAAANASS